MSSPFSTRSNLESPAQALSLPNQLARRAVLHHLDSLAHEQIELTESPSERVRTFGHHAGHSLSARITVHNPRFYRRIATGGSLGAAESYIEGDWDCDDLTRLIRIFLRNQSAADNLESGLAKLTGLMARGWHWLRRNTRAGSQRNIAAHYDLGNDFYKLFLDETLSYSAGYFSNPNDTLAEASLAKIDRLCRKLDLQPEDHLLEIGTGWGALAIHAAKEYSCRVTTTTISREQHALAASRIKDEGLSNRIELLFTDYRDLHGRYDKLVSCEMIEAVGHEFLGGFFQKCSELLVPQGRMALQGIVMNEQRHRQYLQSTDFIQKYIFPGGCLPSILSMGEAVARRTDLRLVHLEDFASGYERTLQCWRQRFMDSLDEVRRLGYPDRFIRMWQYYLCYCEAAFAERFIGVVQVLWAKPDCRCDATSLDLESRPQTFSTPHSLSRTRDDSRAAEACSGIRS